MISAFDLVRIKNLISFLGGPTTEHVIIIKIDDELIGQLRFLEEHYIVEIEKKTKFNLDTYLFLKGVENYETHIHNYNSQYYFTVHIHKYDELYTLFEIIKDLYNAKRLILI